MFLFLQLWLSAPLSLCYPPRFQVPVCFTSKYYSTGPRRSLHPSPFQKNFSMFFNRILHLQVHWLLYHLPTPVLLAGKSRGRRSLEGCSPWGRWASDTTERLSFHFLLSCIGEGNGNPLQCPCLENPRDRGAWWAAIYGVAQSRARLKRLSSSSMITWNVNCQGGTCDRITLATFEKCNHS